MKISSFLKKNRLTPIAAALFFILAGCSSIEPAPEVDETTFEKAAAAFELATGANREWVTSLYGRGWPRHWLASWHKSLPRLEGSILQKNRSCEKTKLSFESKEIKEKWYTHPDGYPRKLLYWAASQTGRFSVFNESDQPLPNDSCHDFKYALSMYRITLDQQSDNTIKSNDLISLDKIKDPPHFHDAFYAKMFSDTLRRGFNADEAEDFFYFGKKLPHIYMDLERLSKNSTKTKIIDTYLGSSVYCNDKTPNEMQCFFKSEQKINGIKFGDRIASNVNFMFSEDGANNLIVLGVPAGIFDFEDFSGYLTEKYGKPNTEGKFRTYAGTSFGSAVVNGRIVYVDVPTTKIQNYKNFYWKTNKNFDIEYQGQGQGWWAFHFIKDTPVDQDKNRGQQRKKSP